jgi:tetratricopeptide (TPR) repeat protein
MPRSLEAYARGAFALAVVAFVQTTSVTLAFADDDKAQLPADTKADAKADELKAKGDAAMEEGSFAEADNLYREAYAISPQPALVYNMGRAEERLGLYVESLRNLEQFNRSASPELKARVPKLAELLAEVRAHVALVTLHSNVAGARVVLRGKYVASTPMKWALATSGGKAMLEVSADGYVPYQKEIVLDEGKKTTLDVNLVAKGGPELALKGTSASQTRVEIPKDEKSPGITSKWWFWTGIGVGVMGGVALTAVLLNTERSAPSGDLGRATAPLLRF